MGSPDPARRSAPDSANLCGGHRDPHSRGARPKTGGTTAVRVTDAVKRFGDTTAVDNVSLSVGCGETICLIGPSGSGKSTLLRLINHLERLDSGEILVNGHLLGYREAGGRLVEDRDANLSAQRQEIGMVFQRFNLFPHLTVLENVMAGPRRVLRVPKDVAAATAHRLLSRVGLEPKAGEYPVNLSGGQQQRVAIARALAMSPAVMLFDEPTSALDPETVSEVLDVMRDLSNDGMTMLIATHELAFAREVSDRIVMMDAGAVVQDCDPSILFSPSAHPRVRAFLSRML